MKLRTIGSKDVGRVQGFAWLISLVNSAGFGVSYGDTSKLYRRSPNRDCEVFVETAFMRRVQTNSTSAYDVSRCKATRFA